MIAPISPLDAQQAWWKQRRSEWHAAYDLESTIGRDHLPAASDLRSGIARHVECRHVDGTRGSSVSTFDPVLAEVMLSWFSTPGDRCGDPFAGGPTRGAVASLLGLTYAGIDIRPDQINANRQWADTHLPNHSPQWRLGDARRFASHVPPLDIVLTCPPYFDLEKYSDDPLDLSRATTYPEFVDAIRATASEEYQALKDDRFCIWIVGDVRDPSGRLRGIVSDTERAHREAGFSLAQSIIYVAPFGTLPVTAARPFSLTRSVARREQHALVFVKGNPREAGRRVAGADPRLAVIPRLHQMALEIPA